MKTIKNNITNKIEINKSIFITKIIKINSIKEVDIELKKIKEEYKDATHHCYAYILDDYKKSSDDNEPGGTAGVPIMQVLTKNNITDVLCVVIRYFGGIKLGAGGLVRAYTKSVTDALSNINLVDLITGFLINFSINYNEQKQIDYLLKNIETKKEYNDLVQYTCKCNEETLTILNKNNIKYTIIEQIKMEL